MKRMFVLLTALMLVFGLSVSARATLIDRGGGLIYDDDLDITWLQDANYAMTSGYDADGRMIWDDAMTWAANLTYGGYTDWRLPTALNADGSGPCYGYECSGSEMGHLFYDELGGTGGSSILTSGDPDLALFSNLQTSYLYWSGTEYGPDGAWDFVFYNGNQGATIKGYTFYAWAVRPGDVSAPVPEPGTLLLLGSGLVGLVGFRKKFKVKTS